MKNGKAWLAFGICFICLIFLAWYGGIDFSKREFTSAWALFSALVMSALTAQFWLD
jgi:hypothetical protein